jgi:hypothetical protein
MKSYNIKFNLNQFRNVVDETDRWVWPPHYAPILCVYGAQNLHKYITTTHGKMKKKYLFSFMNSANVCTFICIILEKFW